MLPACTIHGIMCYILTKKNEYMEHGGDSGLRLPADQSERDKKDVK